MGIVVTIAMLLGLLLSLPLPFSRKLQQSSITVNTVVVLLVLLGLWNSVGYGIRHLHSFWGMAALVSGLFMLLMGIILLLETRYVIKSPSAFMVQAGVLIKPIAVIGLLLCFGLYSITLIQLNLGYGIIQ